MSSLREESLILWQHILTWYPSWLWCIKTSTDQQLSSVNDALRFWYNLLSPYQSMLSNPKGIPSPLFLPEQCCSSKTFPRCILLMSRYKRITWRYPTLKSYSKTFFSKILFSKDASKPIKVTNPFWYIIVWILVQIHFIVRKFIMKTENNISSFPPPPSEQCCFRITQLVMHRVHPMLGLKPLHSQTYYCFNYPHYSI